jgi:predicted Zn-dependent peptidase
MIQRKVLDNGMTVVFKKKTGGVVSVAFAVRNGGANETAENKGISHFIEHMLYKGTPTRDASQIAEEIEMKGGELNGFTSEQLTAFWCKMPSKHLYVALEVLSDMVKNPKFDEKEIEKERMVIFEEMKMYQDNPRLHVFDKIKNNLYEGDFSISIIGTKDSMMKNDVEIIRRYYDKTYTTNNLILGVVGDVNFEEICEFAENNFDKTKSDINEPEIKKRNNISVETRKGIDQANLVLAFHVPKPGDNLYFAAYVLSVLMAGGMSSVLFKEIREKRNLAYAVKGITESEKDFAYNLVYIGTTPENVEIVKKIILDEYKKISNNLSEEKLNQIKEQIIGNYLTSHEDSFNNLFDLLIFELRGNAQDADKFIEEIKSVKLDDVKKLASFSDYSFFALVPED